MKMILKDWSIGYSDKSLLSEINLQLNQGESVFLLGENGSGKSSLIKSILGIDGKLKGELYFLDSNKERKEIPLERMLAYVRAETGIHSRIFVEELLTTGRIPYHSHYPKLSTDENELIIKTAKDLGIEKHLKKDARKLSDGQRQLVLIARAIIQETPFILLDEPATHLDFKNRFVIYELLNKLCKQENKGLLISTHDWNSALKFADKLCCISDGNLYFGNPLDVLFESGYLKELFAYEPPYLFSESLTTKNQKKSISLKVPTEISYLLTYAFEKQDFTISSESNFQISYQNEKFNFDNKDFVKISDLLNYLKNNFTQ